MDDWTRRETVVAYCKSLGEDVREDYPFHDGNWTVMRHWGNKKGFAFVYKRQGEGWVTLSLRARPAALRVVGEARTAELARELCDFCARKAEEAARPGPEK